MSRTRSTTTTPTNGDRAITPHSDAAAAALASAAAALTDALAQIEALKQSLHGKGTRDLTAKAREATEAEKLYSQIKEMITAKPQRFRELCEACKLETPEGENRIKGVLVKMQRDNVGVVNLGSQARALWFIADPTLLERLRAK